MQHPAAVRLTRSRLRESYDVFVERLTALLCCADTPAGAQLAALAALLEAVRGEKAHTFGNHTFSRALTALLCAPGFCAALLGALSSAYLPCPDVLFYTHVAVRKLCDRLADDAGG